VRPRARPVGFVVGAMLIAAACAFPQVSYVFDGGGADGRADSSVFDAAEDLDSTSDGDGLVSAETGINDVYDTEYMFEASADAPVCNQDGDPDPKPGGTCGGNDCDDHDARAWFGEPNYLTYLPTPITKGDWNCNGVIEPEYTPNFNCGTLNTGNCGMAAGFTDAPGCGVASVNFITCKVSIALLCVVDTTTTKTQGCK
jgi:hypothetical protein